MEEIYIDGLADSTARGRICVDSTIIAKNSYKEFLLVESINAICTSIYTVAESSACKSEVLVTYIIAAIEL